MGRATAAPLSYTWVGAPAGLLRCCCQGLPPFACCIAAHACPLCPRAVHTAGELCIEAAPAGGPPAPPASMQQLQCTGLQVESVAEDGSCHAAPRLVARLDWQPPAGSTVRRCHVWGRFLGSSEEAPPQWLGVACANGYVVTRLAVPLGASVVEFSVQAEGRNGLAQQMSQAARMTATLPPLLAPA